MSSRFLNVSARRLAKPRNELVLQPPHPYFFWITVSISLSYHLHYIKWLSLYVLILVIKSTWIEDHWFVLISHSTCQPALFVLLCWVVRPYLKRTNLWKFELVTAEWIVVTYGTPRYSATAQAISILSTYVMHITMEVATSMISLTRVSF